MMISIHSNCAYCANIGYIVYIIPRDNLLNTQYSYWDFVFKILKTVEVKQLITNHNYKLN